MPRQTTVTAIGGVGVAFLSALCCAGPIIAVSLGLSGAGLAATFEPLRPYFLGGSATFLAFGFFVVHREEKAACEPDRPCADATARRRMKLVLWGATMVAVLFATFPSWQTLVF